VGQEHWWLWIFPSTAEFAKHKQQQSPLLSWQLLEPKKMERIYFFNIISFIYIVVFLFPIILAYN
jgi:hypothetical protein